MSEVSSQATDSVAATDADPLTATLDPTRVGKSFVQKILGRLRNGPPVTGYLRGLALRRHFTSVGILAVEKGGPAPFVKSEGGEIHAENILLYPGTRLWANKGGVIRIGNGTYLNRGAEVIAWDRVDIGRDCMIGWDVVILDTDLHAVGTRPLVNKPVSIGDRVWIGCRCIVLKGVTIGEGAIVSAGAIVTRDVAPYSVVAGHPAKVVGQVDREGKPA
jgi:acetyltransferase-like isoleucine patch superfamily enzyme